MKQKVDILLVEDSEYDAEVTFKSMQVKMPSVQYLHLRDGQEALDYLFKQGKYAGQSYDLPQLILLDLELPKVSGVEVLEELKTNDQTKGIPVVVLTISQDLDKMRQVYLTGANSYVIKPISFVKFSLVIADIVHYWLLVNDFPGYKKNNN